MLRNESGQTMMVVGVVLPIFFSAALLFTVDITQGFVHRRSLQSTADAAALAAAYDLVRGQTGSIQSDVTFYAKHGHYTGADPMPACASATQTNCYKTPYVNAAGQTRSDQIEIRLNRDCHDSPTFFGGLVNFVTHTNKFGCVPVSARAVGGIISGEPPPYSFVSLNQSCDNHTLVIRLGGVLTVTNQIYVNSCSDDDGFDVFGAMGEIRDPVDILTHGGWETHDLDLVKVGLKPDGTYYQCPYDTAKPGAGGTAIPAWQQGCPHVGQPLINDPFDILPPPSLSDYSIVINGTCDATHPCYNTSHFNPPYFLDAGISNNATTLIADPASTPEDLTNLVVGSNIVIEGERMTVTAIAAPGAGAVPGAHKLTVTRGVLGTPKAAHTQTQINIAAARRVGDEITISTCPTAHNLSVGDWVQVTLDPKPPAGSVWDKQNGVFEVTEIPDGETAAAPCQFEFELPGASSTDHSQDFGAGHITAVERLNGEAIVGTDAQVKYTAGTSFADVFVTGGNATYTTFGEELEDRVKVDAVAGDKKSFTYAQGGLPDVVGMGSPTRNIITVNRWEGTATVTTAETTLLPGLFTGLVTNGPDTTFNGHGPITANDTLVYSSPGPDQPPDKLANGVTKWQRTGGVTTLTAGTGTMTAGTWVIVHLRGAADTSFDGKFQVSAVAGDKKSFTYAQGGLPNVALTTAPAGTENTYDNLFPVQSYSRSSGVGTVTMSVVTNIGNGNDVMVDVANTGFSGTFKVTNVSADKKTIKFASPGSDFSATGVAGDGVTNDVTKAAGNVNETGLGATVTPDYDTNVSGVAGLWDAATGTIQVPTLEIFALTGSGQTVSTPAAPFPYAVPAGSTQNLPPGIYYGGICIGAPVGATCNPNAGGTCATSSTAAPTTVTMSGTYIIAGGGFYVCGNATVTGNGVLIYNTQDHQAPNAQFGRLGQVEFNTNGTVDLHPKAKTELYGGFLIWQGKDPADPTGPNLDLATAQGNPAQKCDGRATKSTDILLLHTANGLNSFEGTIYAPAPYALFTDQVSGTANLAVLTGCIYIAGATSTFQFIPEHLAGLGSGLAE